jgi:hypothetical protein
LHLLNALLAELSESLVILSSELTTEFSFCAPMHLLNAHLAELPRILNDSASFGLSAEFLPLCTSVHMLNAHLAELYRILSDSVYNCVLLHSLASKVFNNLEVFLLSC